ncbi:MAG: DMT family transporter, partial [Candidatus Dormibacteraeota bacterium]|nr:DMT family transporter [Candidatus Dormibacteraeota bacterium]
ILFVGDRAKWPEISAQWQSPGWYGPLGNPRLGRWRFNVQGGDVTRRGWLLFAAMGLIWGLPYLLIKVAVAEMTPATLVLARTGIGALVLLPVAVSRGNVGELRRHWRPVVLYTFVEVALPWVLLADAERRISSSLAGLLIATVPLVGALLAWRMQHEDRLDRRRVAGLLVGFTGVAVLLGLGSTRPDPGAVGEIAVVSVCYAVGPMIIARRLQSVSAVGVVAVSLVLTAAFYAPVGLLLAPHHLPAARVLGAVVALGVVCTALAFVVFFALIAEAGPVRATVITYLNPAVALGLGVAVLHEPLTAGIVVGFALILAGSLVTNRRGTAAARTARTEVAPPSSVSA